MLPLAIGKRPVKEINEKVLSIAKKFDIENLLDKYPYQISGGEKQRTASSRALITNPKLLFADEPTGALDSKSATEFLKSLCSLNIEEHATIMMVTHDAYAASFCSRILFIKDGLLSNELIRGNYTRQEFFQLILDELAYLGGADYDFI